MPPLTTDPSDPAVPPVPAVRAVPAVAEMFTTVLVANRGEIACRIIRTLHRLGIRAVAVHSDADRAAPHVAMADVAVRLGPAPAHASYLDVDAVIAAARTTGAQAVHPGYGFLSENVALARACVDAGIVFVGPGVEALEVMGDKIRAKAHVRAAGVPVVPGSTDTGLDDAALLAAAAAVGYPLLVKPSAGGGGKGMTVVESAEDLPDALRSARRVAAASFGDDALLLERYLARPRHIEVQVLADTHGTVLHLGERECSLQRRHQKVVEEAPSPLVDAAMRERIGAMACEVARSVGYVGAGTVELLVAAHAPDEAFFIEMNTRLQVEHPVTEMVTGLDLVEWQLRIAAGERLTRTQDGVVLRGHAVEARVYAENPARGFLPTTGTVLALREPTGEGVRVDSGLARGVVVGSHYDPLLAKVIAWGTDRAQALRRLDGALAGTSVLGVHTNVGYLRDVLRDPDVVAGDLDTHLLERRRDVLPADPEPAVLAAAVLWLRARTDDDPRAGETSTPGTTRTPVTASTSTGSGTPWRRDGWRLGEHLPTRYHLATGSGEVVEVAVGGTAQEPAVRVGDRAPVHAVLVGRTTDTVTVEHEGVLRTFHIAADGDVVWVGDHGAVVELRLRSRADLLAEQLAGLTRDPGAVSPEVRSPMPGTVVSVSVETGESVTAGQTLLTVEAMKMEHRLVATTSGIVTLSARPADLVKLDQVVATIAPHPLEGDRS